MPVPPRRRTEAPPERLPVYVPTRGRLDTQRSMKSLYLRELHMEGTVDVTFVVAECEAGKFERLYPWATVHVVPDSLRIGDITDQMLTMEGPRYRVLSDDDFTQVLRRRDVMSISQRGAAATTQDVRDLFGRVRAMLAAGYAHGGVSLRQTNHFCPDGWFKKNTRASGFMFFDTAVLRTEGVRANDVQERQDFHLTLSLLELGYPNRVDYEFMVGQWTNGEGGCSRYRSPEFLEEQAVLLQTLHPDAVKVVYKQRKREDAQKMAGDKGIPDVRITWARSFGTRAAERRGTPKPIQEPW